MGDRIDNWGTPEGIKALRSLLRSASGTYEKKRIKGLLRAIGLKRARDSWRKRIDAVREALQHSDDDMKHDGNEAEIVRAVVAERDAALALAARRREVLREVRAQNPVICPCCHMDKCRADCELAIELETP